MKIGVVGTFIRDHTVPYEGEPYDNIGGIFYSLAFLGALSAEDTVIVPVARIGADLYDDVLQALRPFGRINCDHLLRSEQPNTRVELRYISANERVEITSERMKPLEWEDVEVLADADAILVNMITGVDISLSALQKLSAAGRGWLYLDVHSLVYEIDAEGRRRLNRPLDWQSWVACADGVQVNEAEATVLAEIPSKEKGVQQFGQLAARELAEVCNITAGSRGSHLFWRENGDVRYAKVAAVTPPRVVDVVGCGDAFAAGFVITYARTRNPLVAAKEANRTAAANCTYRGTSGVAEIPKLLVQLSDAD